MVILLDKNRSFKGNTSSPVEFWITGYFNLGRLPHAGIQGICPFPHSVAVCGHMQVIICTSILTYNYTSQLGATLHARV